MEDRIKSELDASLNKYDEKLKAFNAEEQKKKSAEDQFLDEFVKTKDGIIRPAMEELGIYIKQRGHEYDIEEHKEQFDRNRGIYTSSTGIVMKIRPSGYKSIDYISNTPSVGFFANKRAKKVEITENDMMPHWGGSSGSKGAAELAQITKDYVQKQVSDLIKTITDKPYNPR